MTMFDYAKDALYESASTNFVVNNDGDEELHIAYWFKVDYNELDNYWRDYCGGCND